MIHKLVILEIILMNDRILAIIPVSSESTGLVNKSIKNINKKPLIAYTIEAAINSQVFDQVYVSTDNEKYAALAREYGANTNPLRAIKLTKDSTNTNELIAEILKIKNNFEWIVVLQPNSPLRTKEDIKEALKIAKKNQTSVISVTISERPSFLINELTTENKMTNFNFNKIKNNCQNHEEYYPNGAIFICKVRDFLEENTLFTKNAIAYKMDKKNAISINDEVDFALAMYLIKGEEKWEK